jgi:hydroxypyruvate isomerase
LPAAKANNVPNLICFSGNRRNVSDEEAWENCALLLNKVKAQAEDLGVTIIMELLNSKVNHKDYHCDKTAWGVELVNRVNSPRFKLLYDIYHMQIMEGDVIRTIREHKDAIAHYHTGGNPGRNEIDETQELNYKAIAQAIVDIGFQGYYAHEFIPLRDPMTSLQQAVELCDV